MRLILGSRNWTFARLVSDPDGARGLHERWRGPYVARVPPDRLSRAAPTILRPPGNCSGTVWDGGLRVDRTRPAVVRSGRASPAVVGVA